MDPLDDLSGDCSDGPGDWPGPPPDAAWRAAYPDSVWLEAGFDGCVCGTSPGGRLVWRRWRLRIEPACRHGEHRNRRKPIPMLSVPTLVYSTDAIWCVLVRRGLSAEEAASHISPLLGCLHEGFPNFVD